MKGQKKPSAAEFSVVCDGPHATVRLASDVYGEYMQLFDFQ